MKNTSDATAPFAAATGSALTATLIPVPVGATIQPWHWWMTDVLNMTEGERAIYHKFPRSGEKLEAAGKLFEVRVQRPDGSKTRPYVQRFAEQMEAKLLANAHKGGPENWLSKDVWGLMQCLRNEEKELRQAIESGNVAAIAKEAADVANFAMMVASWFEERAMVLADIDATE